MSVCESVYECARECVYVSVCESLSKCVSVYERVSVSERECVRV